MAPYENLGIDSNKGFWGNTTSTLDWCELNYEISFYVAEFWNTISNLGIILPGLVGAWMCWRDKIELRFIISFLSLTVVGLGSWCFHMTLQYSMQLADEVPMLWTSLIVLYCSLEVPSVGETNAWTLLGLIFYGVSCTLIHIFFRVPVVFQTCYGLAVLTMVAMDFKLAKKYQSGAILFWWATGLMVFGFFLWNLDNIMCSSLQQGRTLLPSSIRPLTQLHAWWHILAGYASYLHLLFSVQARCQVLNRRTTLEISLLGLTLRCRASAKLE